MATSIINRRELVDRVLSHNGLVVISAGAGSGKSVLADALRGASAERKVLDDATPNDISSLDGAILISRDPLVEASQPTTLRLTAADIWFSAGEVEALLDLEVGRHPAHPAVATAIVAKTGGWPLAVTSIVKVIGDRPRVRRQINRLVTQGPHFAPVFDQVLGDLPSDVIDHFSDLAYLPMALPEFFVDVSSCSGWHDAQRRGLPLIVAADGSLTMPEVLRHHLAARRPLTEARAVEWGGQLVQYIGLSSTLAVLLKSGNLGAAQAVLLQVPEADRYVEDHVDLLHQIRRLASQVEPEPETLLAIVSLDLRLARFAELESDVERCLKQAAQSDAPLVAHRARILQHTAHARRDPGSITGEVLTELEAEQRCVGDHRSGLELHELNFVVLAGHTDSDSLIKAISLGRDLAAQLAATGASDEAAELLRQVAVGPMFDLGRYNEMVAIDKEASDLVGESIPSERSLVFRALAMALAGRLSEHEEAVDTFEALFGQTSAGWLDAYLWGARMVAASISDDGEGVAYAYRRHRESVGDLANTPSEAVWESLAAAALALVGNDDLAHKALLNAKRFELYDPSAVGLAELVVVARVGDPVRAEGLCEQLDRSGLLRHEARWRARIEVCFAARRLGARVDGELESILQAATRVGMGGLARILARPLIERREQVLVRLFGVVSVDQADGSTELPPGKPADLVKILALNESPMHVDAVIEALWPEGELESGRRRIRNVVSRARQMVGRDMLLRSGDLLALSPLVTTDLGQFRRAVAAANATVMGSMEFVAAARQALEISRPGLLPGDVFAEWLDGERWRIDSTVARLLDRLSQCPPDEVDLDWLVDIAVDLGIEDEALFLRVARMARSAGRPDVANLAAREAERLAERAE